MHKKTPARDAWCLTTAATALIETVKSASGVIRTALLSLPLVERVHYGSLPKFACFRQPIIQLKALRVRDQAGGARTLLNSAAAGHQTVHRIASKRHDDQPRRRQCHGKQGPHGRRGRSDNLRQSVRPAARHIFLRDYQ